MLRLTMLRVAVGPMAPNVLRTEARVTNTRAIDRAENGIAKYDQAVQVSLRDCVSLGYTLKQTMHVICCSRILTLIPGRILFSAVRVEMNTFVQEEKGDGDT